MKKRLLIYDCETLRVPYSYGFKAAGIKYADGWRDFKNLGISCIGFHRSWTLNGWGDFSILPQSHLGEFQAVVDQADEIAGFNSSRFDDLLCEANGIRVKTTYDILLEAWSAAGLDPNYNFPENGDPKVRATYSGFRLDDLAIANLRLRKTLSGTKAPELWQRKQYKKVLGYCLQDVQLERDVLAYGLQGRLWHGASRRFLKLREI